MSGAIYNEIAVERISTRVRDRNGRYQGDECPPCGTMAGYYRAYNAKKAGRAGCGPCEACRAARRHYDNRREKRPREVARMLDRSQKRYGITYSEKLAILESQGGQCSVCNGASPSNPRGWATEHNHETGEVRGVTCQPCNHLLGFAEKAARVAGPGSLAKILGPQAIDHLQNGPARVRAILLAVRGSK